MSGHNLKYSLIYFACVYIMLIKGGDMCILREMVTYLQCNGLGMIKQLCVMWPGVLSRETGSPVLS